jgi:uncharacterized integral membrane protein
MSNVESNHPDDLSLTPAPESADVETGPTTDEPEESTASSNSPSTHTRIKGYWTAVTVGLLVLVVLIIFILENGQRAEVTFFGAHAHLPQGVALLLAAVIGGLVVALVGVARILQLRTQATRASRRESRRRR